MVLTEAVIILGGVLFLGGAAAVISGSSSSGRNSDRSNITGERRNNSSSDRSSSQSDNGSGHSSGDSSFDIDLDLSSESDRRGYLSSLKQRMSDARTQISDRVESLTENVGLEEQEIEEVENQMQKLLEEEKNLDEVIKTLEQEYGNSELQRELENMRDRLNDDASGQEVMEEIKTIINDEEREIDHIIEIEKVSEELGDELLQEYNNIKESEDEIGKVQGNLRGISQKTNEVIEKSLNGQYTNEEKADRALSELRNELSRTGEMSSDAKAKLAQVSKELPSIRSGLESIFRKDQEVKNEEENVEEELSETGANIKEKRMNWEKLSETYEKISDLVHRESPEEASGMDKGFKFGEWLEDKEEEVYERENKIQNEVERVETDQSKLLKELEIAEEAIEEEAEDEKAMVFETKVEYLWQEIKILIARNLVVGSEESPSLGEFQAARVNSHISERKRTEMAKDLSKILKRNFNSKPHLRPRMVEKVREILNEFDSQIPPDDEIGHEKVQEIKDKLNELEKELETQRLN